jgi:hypothetical protein
MEKKRKDIKEEEDIDRENNTQKFMMPWNIIINGFKKKFACLYYTTESVSSVFC